MCVCCACFSFLACFFFSFLYIFIGIFERDVDQVAADVLVLPGPSTQASDDVILVDIAEEDDDEDEDQEVEIVRGSTDECSTADVRPGSSEYMSIEEIESSLVQAVAAATIALRPNCDLTVTGTAVSDVSVNSDNVPAHFSGPADVTATSVVAHSTPHRGHSGFAPSSDDERRARIMRRLNAMHPPEDMVNGFSRSGMSRATFQYVFLFNS
jgi:hypothetical protein